MSDLISRSELLETIERYGFSAIANDKEREYIKNIIIKTVQEQPTAYDIGKVVEELEKLQEKALRVHNYDISFYATGMMQKAIEIVKQGGVTDDVCEWKQGKVNDEWQPSCEPNSAFNVFGVAWFKKCPYCGKKIKVVEE